MLCTAMKASNSLYYICSGKTFVLITAVLTMKATQHSGIFSKHICKIAPENERKHARCHGYQTSSAKYIVAMYCKYFTSWFCTCYFSVNSFLALV